MASMRAQVLHRWGEDVAYEEVPIPEPGPDEALIRVEACGVGAWRGSARATA